VAFAIENVPTTGWLPLQLRAKGYDGPPNGKREGGREGQGRAGKGEETGQESCGEKISEENLEEEALIASLPSGRKP
jgi:hypothetical protein